MDVVWEFLQGELSAVQKEIDEWRDTMDSWDNHCQVRVRSGTARYTLIFIITITNECFIPFLFSQVMMKSCTGIDYTEFASFLKTVANHRSSFLSSRGGNAFSETLSALGPHHATFDLQRVAHIFESMLNNEDFKRVEASSLGFKVEELLQEIRDTISKYNTAY